jgi:hypothetical protein
MIAVDIKTGEKIESGIPRGLFDAGFAASNQYDVTPDGQHFYLLKPPTERTSTLITVTLNWTSLLER